MQFKYFHLISSIQWDSGNTIDLIAFLIALVFIGLIIFFAQKNNCIHENFYIALIAAVLICCYGWVNYDVDLKKTDSIKNCPASKWMPMIDQESQENNSLHSKNTHP